ncbi:uncharacterized protein PITG_20812 [Phytophthora infestans T30-4]|uniref:Uncharacterized protein n=1 Tax=Phytophthora infestans (strain T30-4) TaxID=403677 RepID=D0P319_PHYIT|nr:uncharacterized protein PITG_20812 [Phytophthora infestans T30-4]EEY58788.1 hypothetical protein PITG_20812 [Phytophthora infestans T30-4]|eukprot:XP_002895309.1 hypothetical protein PITG_20812 [Phytophthora infestans T30-4]
MIRLATCPASCFATFEGNSPSSVFISASMCVACRRRPPLNIANTVAEAAADARESASATTFVVPGRYKISNSYSCKVNVHLCSLPAKFGRVIGGKN